jgi:hypothetical protein
MVGAVVLALLIVLGVYFLPFIIALLRGHRQTASIFVLNLFLGWTLIGYAVALAMAVSNQGEKTIIVTTSEAQGEPAGTTTIISSGGQARAPTIAALSPGHKHEWIDSQTTNKSSGEVVKMRRCRSCGIFQPRPTEISGTSAPASLTPVSGVTSTKDGLLEQVQKLADLHKAGVLTDDEFASKKADLLARL